MKKVGKIITYDGCFGVIVDEHDKVDFSKKDVITPEVKVGDIVEYRKEKREPNLNIARYVKVLKKNNDI